MHLKLWINSIIYSLATLKAIIGNRNAKSTFVVIVDFMTRIIFHLQVLELQIILEFLLFHRNNMRHSK